MEKFIMECILIKKKTLIPSRFITHKVKYFKANLYLKKYLKTPAQVT